MPLNAIFPDVPSSLDRCRTPDSCDAIVYSAWQILYIYAHTPDGMQNNVVSFQCGNLYCCTVIIKQNLNPLLSIVSWASNDLASSYFSNSYTAVTNALKIFVKSSLFCLDFSKGIFSLSFCLNVISSKMQSLITMYDSWESVLLSCFIFSSLSLLTQYFISNILVHFCMFPLWECKFFKFRDFCPSCSQPCTVSWAISHKVHAQ